MSNEIISEKQVLEALSSVIDPDLGRDIVALGFVKNIKIDGGDIKFDVELTTPACPVKERLKSDCEHNVKKLAGFKSVAVNMTSRVRGGGASYKQENLKGVKNLLAVASGKGGVGKSTVAVNLAFALKESGASVGILDADIYGPSLPTMLGVTDKPEVDSKRDMIYPVEKYGVKLISMGFLLNNDSPVIWRGPMVSGILQQFLNQVIWGELDYLVFDLPPGTGDIQLTLTQQSPLTGAVIVTTPQEVSTVDARRGLKMFEEVNVPVLGVIENMSYFICDGCDKKHYIFKKNGGLKISQELNVPLLGNIPIEGAIADSGDSGVPVVISKESRGVADAYMELAGKVAASLSMIKEGKSSKEGVAFPVEVNKRDNLKFEIVWSDGHKSVYGYKHVRSMCQCAECVDEWTGEQRINDSLISDDVTYNNFEKVGNYAVTFSWSDGHVTGIYSYEFLKKICECEECGGEKQCKEHSMEPKKEKCSHDCSCSA